ncbi:MAG: indole-3-glycerol phosphate synthase TrpC [Verrucomicrobiota bacterium]|jgi:indole-3-glycerol phosphate synthase|nr:indole-3-glycerol phosphate synthase TrpC [Verrucomicrobiota bacterium]
MSILDEIVAHKRTEFSASSDEEITIASLQAQVVARGGVRDFTAALANPRAGDVGLIAEVKKASPSAGVIRSDFDPVKIAQEYESAGASCISVLTDEKFFQGAPSYLKDIREAVDLPLLRKDFVIDERQISEAVEWGADAVLLIVAILDDAKLARFHEMVSGAGLSVLVEVHDATELKRAQAINAPLIGVNNRNLKDFSVDLGITESLAAQMNLQQALLVSESGIHSRADVKRLTDCGVRAILVGESLMREDDINAKVRALGGGHE